MANVGTSGLESRSVQIDIEKRVCGSVQIDGVAVDIEGVVKSVEGKFNNLLPRSTVCFDGVAVDIEGVVKSVEGKFNNLFPMSTVCCVLEVPKRLRKINEEAYSPIRVSIGPLHHGKEELKSMDQHKLWYLQDLLDCSGVGLKELIKFIWDREKSIRECYLQTISISPAEFVEIILLDAAFVIGVLLRYRFRSLRRLSDPLFRIPWMVDDINRDLKLLENQLPFFILQDLFQMADINVVSFEGKDEDVPTFIELTRTYFKASMEELNQIPPENDFSEVVHFLDFLRICLIPNEGKPRSTCEYGKAESRRCATELQAAGVKFVSSTSSNLFNIEFSESDHVLKMPRVLVTDKTECLLRNLLFFEQCHYKYKIRYMSDYVKVLQCLIPSPKDVELLVRSRVIDNHLGDNQEVSKLFKELGREIPIDGHHFYFYELHQSLNAFCEKHRNKLKAIMKGWWAILLRNYFNTPFQVLGIVVGLIVLVLTIIQAVCAIKAVPK